ncbi:50S ribosomal protein L21 [Pseudobythopirellula maris]|uniref:Large ribosomal subunit protein bL21 n=1 Tax=Pseudobythopirellula maris TaxID=2527991 RepID=A0A5C5ZXU2_9BACT|nr:50S ribosomal protein L21 [Pseudobythopirellula maris]TWT91093.1 50S ribosomal protein L21 [Pseudobythopirellula maris]
MYAIIKDGGRQYKVEEGQELALDYREAKPGDKLELGSVLAVGAGGDLKFGAPLVDGASVAAEVIGTTQGPKIVVQKLRRRKNSRRKTGHRKMFTKVKIGKITA